MLYELATESEQSILQEQYDVAPFSVMTITIERIFIDKLFAAEAYVRQSTDPQRAFEAAKHIYDLVVMRQQPNIQNLLADEDLIKKLLDIRIEEEAGRLDGIPGVMPKDFTFFDAAVDSNAVRRAYAVMQAQYVLRTEDRIEYADAMAALGEIRNSLLGCKVWTTYEPSKEVQQHIQQIKSERLHTTKNRNNRER